MATKTADGVHNYGDVWNINESGNNVNLAEWVVRVHTFNSQYFKWKYMPLKPGAFGYDNIVHSLAHLFANCSDYSDEEHMADLIHEGWILNYVFWRDNKPFSKNKDYIKPASPLGDERRNTCASTKYSDLVEEEKEKDRVIARLVQKYKEQDCYYKN